MENSYAAKFQTRQTTTGQLFLSKMSHVWGLLSFLSSCISAHSEGLNGDVKVGESCKNNACKAVSTSTHAPPPMLVPALSVFSWTNLTLITCHGVMSCVVVCHDMTIRWRLMSWQSDCIQANPSETPKITFSQPNELDLWTHPRYYEATTHHQILVHPSNGSAERVLADTHRQMWPILYH